MLGVTSGVAALHDNVGFDGPVIVPIAGSAAERAQTSVWGNANQPPGFIIRFFDAIAVGNGSHSYRIPCLGWIFHRQLSIVVGICVVGTDLMRLDISR